MGESRNSRVEYRRKEYYMTDDQLLNLIEKYLDHTASAEELADLEQWYRQQQQKPGPFDHIDSAVRRRFEQQVLNKVHANIEQASAPVIFMRRKRAGWQRITAAAAVILIACAVWLLYRPAPPARTVQTGEQRIQPGALLAIIQNHSANDSLLLLEDGSEVRLAPNSSLQYGRPFADHRRTVHLQGKAYFNVAKDAGRLFTVYSNGIATTALGTAFTITAFPAAAEVKVQLHEGRVVVKSADSTRARFLPNTYLAPGQELACNLSSRMYAVQSMVAAAGAVRDKAVPPAVRLQPGLEASFEGAPLATVLQQMEKNFHVRIRFNPQEIADMEFSGDIHASDSIGYVLRRIATLHQLDIVKKPDGYLIRKNQ